MRRMAACFGPCPEEPALAAAGLSGADSPIGQLIDAGRYDHACAAVSERILPLGTVGTSQTSRIGASSWPSSVLTKTTSAAPWARSGYGY